MTILKLGSALPAWVPAEKGPQGNIINKGTAVAPIWSSKEPPPAIGSVVKVRVNGIGPSKVLQYFVQEGYLGVNVMPEAPPEWYVKQNGPGASCYVFGSEIGEKK